jgi:hypothetical protein
MDEMRTYDVTQGIYFIYLLGWRGNESTVTAAIYWTFVPALDDK